MYKNICHKILINMVISRGT